jgi:hypothetical protein
MFKSHSSPVGIEDTTDAIPAGTKRTVTSASQRQRLLQVSDVIGGMPLPPQHIIDFLFAKYLESVHWFMLVFHQPSLQAEMNEIVTTGLVPRHRIPFLVLVLLILGMGARYARESDSGQPVPNTELSKIETKLLFKVEEKFLDVFGEGTIEAVQISSLLASYYLYHRQTKKAFAVVGAGVKSAQAQGLHHEPSWGQIDPVAREVRKRAWWALVVADGSVSRHSPDNVTDRCLDLRLYATANRAASPTTSGKST